MISFNIILFGLIHAKKIAISKFDIENEGKSDSRMRYTGLTSFVRKCLNLYWFLGEVQRIAFHLMLSSGVSV